MFFGVGLIAGCGIARPEAVVKKFFDAAKVQDREAMASVLSRTTEVDLDTGEEAPMIRFMFIWRKK